MKCWRCKRKGIDSTMIKDDGYSYCPECVREITYWTRSRKRRMRSYDIGSQGCLTKILYIVLGVLGIIVLIVLNPWLLLLLLVPLILLVIRLCKMDDNDDDF